MEKGSVGISDAIGVFRFHRFLILIENTEPVKRQCAVAARPRKWRPGPYDNGTSESVAERSGVMIGAGKFVARARIPGSRCGVGLRHHEGMVGNARRPVRGSIRTSRTG